jgi:hypothetical protein
MKGLSMLVLWLTSNRPVAKCKVMRSLSFANGLIEHNPSHMQTYNFEDKYDDNIELLYHNVYL